MSEVSFKFDDMRLDYANLALNKHITDEYIEKQVAYWENKYEYSDAYMQTLAYKERAREWRMMLSLRNKYGVKINDSRTS